MCSRSQSSLGVHGERKSRAWAVFIITSLVWAECRTQILVPVHPTSFVLCTFIPVLKMQIVFTSTYSNFRMCVHLGLIKMEFKVG